MIHTKTLSKSNPTELLKKAMHTASCYGFDSMDKVIIQEEKWAADVKKNNPEDEAVDAKKEKCIKQTTKSCNTDTNSDEVLCALKIALNNKLLPCDHPLLIYQSNSSNDSEEKTLNFGLIAVGMKKSIAEALILRTATAILEDIGIENTQIHINSMGDIDSSVKFVNELSLYLRKNINSVPSDIRQIIKKDIFKAYDKLHREYNYDVEEIPQPIKFLSDNNRKHLSEVLEYMETGNIPYEIDNFLVGSNECYSQTLFEIHDTNENKEHGTSVLAKGGRCDELVKRKFNVDIPTVGIVFEFEKKGIKERELQNIKRVRKPKVCFIQLGSEAKRKSLPIIDTLRKSNIYTYHSLDSNKLGEQLYFAEYLKVSYSIIMGHREALDDTVIVRDMGTQFQHTVLVEDLSKYLKEINV